MNNREKGKYGEKIAADYLLKIGYEIICMNYECKLGEIDIIALTAESTIVFLEVKASQNRYRGNPLEKITHSKQKQIIKMSKLYLYEHRLKNIKVRYDAIGLIKNKITHLKSAFKAT